ncbi:MAG: hypothetical protein JNL43_15115 [Flavobacteriales bacterium]|nr:hypothetical protein [Flavobacteriales bacterium]
MPKEEVGRTLIVVGRDDVRGSLPGPCQSFVYDYTGLYPIVDTLPGITEDSIYIDTLLKEAGMKVIDYGWGNWQDGPRMINMKLALETCTCTVTKLYLFHDELPDGYWNSRIIERVVCNVPDSLVPRWTDDKHMQAHRFSSHHRAQVLASDSCGCFHCKRIFTSREVSEWVDPDESGLGQTALCPYCGIDAVIYRISGYPFDKEFLTRMNRHWF